VRIVSFAFAVQAAAMLLASLYCVLAWLWDRDGRWGWTALVLLVFGVIFVFASAGFSGIADGRDRRKRGVFKDPS
jgi:drug/metabolite transporter (DMT)-like permease